MSNYTARTKHKPSGRVEEAEWLDDHFGRHRYGVRFPDGTVYREEECEVVEETGDE